MTVIVEVASDGTRRRRPNAGKRRRPQRPRFYDDYYDEDESETDYDYEDNDADEPAKPNASAQV